VNGRRVKGNREKLEELHRRILEVFLLIVTVGISNRGSHYALRGCRFQVQFFGESTIGASYLDSMATLLKETAEDRIG